MNERGFVASFVAVIVTLGFLCMVLFVCLHDIPTTNKDLANILLGALGAQFVNVVNFYFGSSRDAARANDRLAAATPAAPPPSVAQATADNDKKS